MRFRLVLQPTRPEREMQLEFQLPGEPEVIWTRGEVIRELLDNEVIRHTNIRCRESKVRKGKIKTIHRKGDFTLQFAEIGLLEAGSVPHDKRAFAFVNILQRRQPPDALTPPRV